MISYKNQAILRPVRNPGKKYNLPLFRQHGMFDKKAHWETIYRSRAPEVSWYQPVPATSLAFLSALAVPSTAAIIDIGGGDSLLADHLLKGGYRDITVLDISEKALLRAKERLGSQAAGVKWIVADVTDFIPARQYDVWHDRAAFHFLTEEKDIESYLRILDKALAPEGVAIIGTFSEDGPTRCSGIAIKQYSESSLSERLSAHFRKINCLLTDHLTPSGATQHFLFCSFRKIHTAS
jgi:2-polyprenyl-3-methyl-5-hydroxy-6-metoxy-1,4-benzoquinol methylase